MKYILFYFVFFICLTCSCQSSKSKEVNLSALQNSSTVKASSELPEWVSSDPVLIKKDGKLFFKLFFDKQPSINVGFKTAEKMAWKRIVFTITDKLNKNSGIVSLKTNLSEYHFTELLFLSDVTNLKSISQEMKIINRYWELRKNVHELLTYNIYLRVALPLDFLENKIKESLLVKLAVLKITNSAVIRSKLTNINLLDTIKTL